MDKQIKIKIAYQGKPIVNRGVEWKKSKDMRLLLVDLKSKYCFVFATTEGDYPGVCIDSNKESLYLKKIKKSATSPLTAIDFPEYKGWSPFMASISKYTLSVLLIKR